MHSNQVPVKRYTDRTLRRVTATAVDDDETEATDDDDETVGFSNVPPSIQITKTANVSSST